MMDIPAVRLPNGVVLALPLAPELSEFALAGNFRAYPAARLLGFYDESTATGAVYFETHGTWALQQPVSRALFWAHCDVLAIARPAAEIAAEATAAAGRDPA